MSDQAKCEILGPGGLYAASREEGVVRATVGCGIALALLDTATRTYVLAHMLLPDSAIDRRRSQPEPMWFVDTGVALALERMLELRAMGQSRTFDVVVAGAAALSAAGEGLTVAARNINALDEQFGRLNLRANIRRLGGVRSRMVILDAGAGTLRIEEDGVGALDV